MRELLRGGIVHFRIIGAGKDGFLATFRRQADVPRYARLVPLAEIADAKNDHQILNATLTLQRQNKDRKVILVTKDIALRLKAKSLNILSEDFLTGKVRDVREKLYTGRTVRAALDELAGLQDFIDLNARYYVDKAVDASPDVETITETGWPVA